MSQCFNCLIILILLQTISLSSTRKFVDYLIEDYGSSAGKLSTQEIDKAISHLQTFVNEDLNNQSHVNYKCDSADGILKRHSLTSPVNKSSINIIAPWIQHQLNVECTNFSSNEDKKLTKKPLPQEVWGYGLLFVTLINICASLGIIVIPFMRYTYYRLIMAFMVALAVGSLAGSALLVLIPEAMHLNILVETVPNYSYIWQGVVIFGGIYAFFILERILKSLIELKVMVLKLVQPGSPDLIVITNEGGGHSHSQTQEELPSCSMNIRREPKSDIEYRTPPELRIEGCRVISSMEDVTPRSQSMNGDVKDEIDAQTALPVETHKNNGGNIQPDHQNKENELERQRFLSGSSATSRRGRRIVAPVAWMIIFGDGVHNFIDGLSLGAAFAKGTFIGISLSIAVLCEELPHELGDFAILLNSGMTVRKALVMNLISASSCYIGFIVGALLGEMPSASTWVFAFAGGMFLYISLVDMLPEVNHAMESKEAASLGRIKLFLLQNLGLLTGFGLLLLMAYYGGDIQLDPLSD